MDCRRRGGWLHSNGFEKMSEQGAVRSASSRRAQEKVPGSTVNAEANSPPSSVRIVRKEICSDWVGGRKVCPFDVLAGRRWCAGVPVTGCRSGEGSRHVGGFSFERLPEFSSTLARHVMSERELVQNINRSGEGFALAVLHRLGQIILETVTVAQLLWES